MQKIIPHLWFDKEAEEAAKLYTSIFSGGKIHNTTHYNEAGFEIHGQKAGTVMTVEFEIEGFRFIALNGGPLFKFTPAISFFVMCKTKEEVDGLYEKLSEGGSSLMPLDSYPFSERYAWVADKYGLTWQIIYSDKPFDQKIFPSLLFVKDKAGKAEEAIKFYTSVFKNSKIGDIARYGAGMEPDKEGSVMYADFFLAGQKFAAMDSAREHEFTFNEAISLLINCSDQIEIDSFWEALSAVPESEQCGWVKDKFGVSWQIAPAGMDLILNNPDKEKAKRGMNAMLQMKKIDMEKLRKAVE